MDTNQNQDFDETTSPFRSFVMLAGACLGLATVWWLRQNLGAQPEEQSPAEPGPRPAGGPSPERASPPAREAEHFRQSPGAQAPSRPANDDRPAADAKPARKKAKKKAQTKTKPESTEPADDLVEIDGIGPKMAQVLADAGIRTFDQLAGKSADELRELLISVNSRYRMFDPETWPEQARALAAGLLKAK